MPATGAFYSAENPFLPPLPGNLFGLSGWPLGNGIYLLDDLGGAFSAFGGGFHAMDAPSPGGIGGNDGFTNNFPPYVFPTNGLWLWITNVSNGIVYANLNGATDFVYEIYSSTNLATEIPATNWNIETEVFATASTNAMPFTVPMNGRNLLALWARDWTWVTSNGKVPMIANSIIHSTPAILVALI